MKITSAPAKPRRAGRSGKARSVLLALLFAALGVPVYWFGARTLPVPPQTAQAIVRLPADATTPQAAREEILAEPNVHRALRTCPTETGLAAPPSAASIQSVRDRLGVWVSTGRVPDASLASVHIECAYQDSPDAAIALLDRLARQFAQSVRQRQQTEADRVYHEAEQAAGASHQRLDEAQRRLDAFVQQCLKPVDRMPAPALAAPKAAQPAVNPDWLAVRRQIEHARAYREQLLVDRTPLHPMVQAADAEIDDLEKRLAAIPHEMVPAPGNLAEELRQMTDPLPQPPGLIGQAAEQVDTLEQPLGRFDPPGAQPQASAAQGPSTTSPPPEAASQERLDKFLALKRDVEAAQADYQRAVARRDEAARRRLHLPPIEVVAARAVAPATTAAQRPPHRALLALMVALAGAVGIGMVATGIAGHATFADAAQARAVLSVPVLATVPAADRADARLRRRRWLEGLVVVLCGLFLLAVCLGVLLATRGAVGWL